MHENTNRKNFNLRIHGQAFASRPSTLARSGWGLGIQATTKILTVKIQK